MNIAEDLLEREAEAEVEPPEEKEKTVCARLVLTLEQVSIWLNKIKQIIKLMYETIYDVRYNKKTIFKQLNNIIGNTQFFLCLINTCGLPGNNAHHSHIDFIQLF